MNKTKTIDYLFEDPPLQHQQFALVSIVGPHMPQKCDVWGLKIRGTAESLEKAKAMSQKLLKIDNNYDIYTVEVGKFFPLTIEPTQVSDIEYQNTQLNTLIKSYLENRELANEQWHARKNEMIANAIREGKEQSSSKPEHPIAVLQRIKNFEKSIEETKEQLESIQKDLELSKNKFNNYTEEERKLATDELNSAIAQITDGQETVNVQELKDELSQKLETGAVINDSQHSKIDALLQEIKTNELELSELEELKTSINKDASPNIYARTVKNIQTIQETISKLKEKLNDSTVINDYINSNYGESEFSKLMDS